MEARTSSSEPEVRGPEFHKTADGTELATWHVGPAEADTVVVWVHANGFTGRMWLPVIEALGCRPNCSHLIYDLRGQGISSKPAPDVGNYDWQLQAEDLIEIVRSLHSKTVDAVGHSMGGAIIALAAASEPGLFRSAALFEPIIPVAERMTLSDPEANPLVSQARRRRASFSSVQECRERLGKKPPYSFWDPEVFEYFLSTALVPAPESGEHAVKLACPPEVEAVNYIAGGMHDAYQKLEKVDCITLLFQGSRSPKGGFLDASALVDKFPRATYREVEDTTHFAPFEKPRRFAGMLCDFWERIQGSR